MNQRYATEISSRPAGDALGFIDVDEQQRIIGQNRVYWEAIASERHGEPVDFFRAGGSALKPEELAVIGDPAGLRVLQLACAVGDESLTFAQSGATVTAVDISPTHLDTGRRKAAALGLEVDFREQDMMRLDPDLTGFDLIYLSSGAICWVPDLDAWAASVADRLNPVGRLVICEHHPLWEVLSVTDDRRLRVVGSYFDAARAGYTDPRKAPQVTWGRDDPLPGHTSFVWNLGAVVTALIGAGLVINSLQEFPVREMYADLGADAEQIPAVYLLGATKPEASR
jgi:SAM-dependent methyltransferase